MNIEWLTEETEFLRCNYLNMSYKEIGGNLNRSYKSVSRKAERLGLSKKENRLWSMLEEVYLIDNYNILSISEIAENLNRSRGAVLNKAWSCGLRVDYRYYTPPYNENFFDEWSVQLAWVVGIVLSDGHVSDISNGRFVRIKMNDIDVIDKIKLLTNHLSEKGRWIVEFYGDKVWKFFRYLDMSNHKSHNAKFSTKIPSKFITHVIRGVFDGDGSISLSNNTGYPSARICGTIDVVEYITEYIKLPNCMYRNSDINYTIQYTGDNAIEFLNTIYKGTVANIRMNRKYYKYLKALKWGVK